MEKRVSQVYLPSHPDRVLVISKQDLFAFSKPFSPYSFEIRLDFFFFFTVLGERTILSK